MAEWARNGKSRCPDKGVEFCVGATRCNNNRGFSIDLSRAAKERPYETIGEVLIPEVREVCDKRRVKVTSDDDAGTDAARPAKNHSLCQTRPLADSALWRMALLFEESYTDVGRLSIPREHLIKTSLLMAFDTVRSERLFCGQLGYNVPFK